MDSREASKEGPGRRREAARAGLMKGLSSFWILLKAVPDVVEIIFLIINGVRAGVEFIEFKIDLKKFRDAQRPARDEKNTSQLEDIFRKKSDRSNDPARKP